MGRFVWCLANMEGSGDDLRTSEQLGVEGVTETK